MSEEIFGPIMPILTFDNFDSMIEGLKDKEGAVSLNTILNKTQNL